MQEVRKDVFMKVDGEKTCVGTAVIQAADTLAEAVELDGEAQVVQKRNALTLTTEMNRIRGEARSGPGKKKTEQAALARITPAEWQEIAGDLAAIQALQAKYVAEIELENQANLEKTPQTSEEPEPVEA